MDATDESRFAVLRGPLCFRDEVSSTQDEARRLLQEGEAGLHPGAAGLCPDAAVLPMLSGGALRHLLTVSARFQSQGRGRRGRTWLARKDAAVLVSLAFAASEKDACPGARCYRACRLGLQASLAAALCLEHLAQCPASIKWPNDVLLDGRKTAGVLVETFPFGPAVGVVVGVGINVKCPPPSGGGALIERVPGIGVERVRALFLNQFDLVLGRDDRLRELAEFNRRLIPPPQIEAAGEVYDVKGAAAGGFVASDGVRVCHVPFGKVVDWGPMPPGDCPGFRRTGRVSD